MGLNIGVDQIKLQVADCPKMIDLMRLSLTLWTATPRQSVRQIRQRIEVKGKTLNCGHFCKAARAWSAKEEKLGECRKQN